MINHLQLTMKRLNDNGKMTTRGFLHVFSKPSVSGVLLVEVWGYKPGNGFCRYMNHLADDWMGYLSNRLDSKGMAQVDGSNSKLEATFEVMPEENLTKYVTQTLLPEIVIARKDEAVSKVEQFMQFPTCEGLEDAALRTAYRVCAEKDRGGFEIIGLDPRNNVTECDAPSITISGADAKHAPTKVESYTEWGTF